MIPNSVVDKTIVNDLGQFVIIGSTAIKQEALEQDLQNSLIKLHENSSDNLNKPVFSCIDVNYKGIECYQITSEIQFDQDFVEKLK